MAKKKVLGAAGVEEETKPLETPTAETPKATPEPVKSDFEWPEKVSVVVSEWKVPMFQVIPDGKGNGRIYGKEGQPISSVLPLLEASRQASRHNALDPEQQDAKARNRK